MYRETLHRPIASLIEIIFWHELILMYNNTVNYTQTNYSYLSNFHHQPGDFFVKYEYFDCLSVINCIIVNFYQTYGPLQNYFNLLIAEYPIHLYNKRFTLSTERCIPKMSFDYNKIFLSHSVHNSLFTFY